MTVEETVSALEKRLAQLEADVEQLKQKLKEM